MREIDRCFEPIFFRDLDGVVAHKLSYYNRLSVGTESRLSTRNSNPDARATR